MSAARAMPHLVLFDMDDVLCAYDRHARAAHLARLAGRTTEAVIDAIWESGFESLGDGGTIDAATYLRGFGERIGYPLTQAEWLEARRVAMQPRAEVLTLVRRVRDRARIGVLTNNPTLVIDHLAFLFPELPPLFGANLFSSAGLGGAKPTADCFGRCLAALATSPGDALFVDDLPENVAGAEAAGLQAHRFTSPATLAAALTMRGLI